MASIVLGVAGGFVGGPVGAILGGAIGTYIDRAILQHRSRHKPSPYDLSVMASTFGMPIPVVYGRTKIAGNLIQSSLLQKTTSQINGDSKTGKGGKGGGTKDTYSINCAVGICRGPIRNVWRIYADSKLIFDLQPNEGPAYVSGTNPEPIPLSTFTPTGDYGGIISFSQSSVPKDENVAIPSGKAYLYYGTEDQPQDALMQSVAQQMFGSNAEVPAYKGLAYVVFENFPLEFFGERVPNFSFEVNGYDATVTSSSTTLASVVSDICAKCNLDPARIDISVLTDNVQGYAISNEASGRVALEPLQEVFLFDLVESNGKLTARYRYSDTAVATIEEGDLGARIAGDEPGSDPQPRVTEIRKQDLDLPQSLTLRYRSTAGNAYVGTFGFEVGTQYAKRARAAVDLIAKLSYDTPIVMADADAAALVDRIIGTAYINRTTYELSLPLRYVALEAGDVIAVNWTDSEGNALSGIVYLQQVDIGADGTIKCSGVGTDAVVYSTTQSGQSQIAQAQPVIIAQETTFRLLELPPLRDEDDSVGFYWAACGVGDSLNWGTGLFRSTDGGASFSEIGATTTGDVIGTTVTSLPAPGSTAVWDTINTVQVRLISGTLSSTTPLNVLNKQANIACIDGEIVGFCNATLDNGIWTLSLLLRGFQGTDIAAADHPVGGPFTLLSPTAVSNRVEGLSAIGLDWIYAAINATAEQHLALTGLRIKPEAASHASITYDASSNATISWVPRRRIGWEWIDGVEQGVDEDLEDYSIDIIGAGGTVVRTITAWSAVTGTVGNTPNSDTGLRQCSYSAAEQASDGLSPPLTATIYQLSRRVGRGLPRTVTR